ncbi:disulfide bond formation protein DsbB [Shewanella gelidii]|uniref:Disulfide bond formation protein B n=1 Tax=Shewanella gelidii TaxID=1642821 RepID=A0A917JTU0_9GAMM|nr:disulfide bond formation protein DsbB [Shewanella gelidii]MCL1098625.1 disulfide bond formation protein DsbB [Shewanella gelidii]GGI86534.1 disulfide bond formation protein B [Shewanella gelidii]
MQPLISVCRSRKSWLALTIGAILLEVIALFFQYGMHLEPCVMCIYQRVAVMGLIFAGLIGMIQPQHFLIRSLGFVIWGISAAWGLSVAIELVDIQTNPSPFATCPFLPEFPSWMPLHDWLPSVFMPTGMCSEVPWQLFGITMGQWMIGVFSVMLVICILLLPFSFVLSKYSKVPH